MDSMTCDANCDALSNRPMECNAIIRMATSEGMQEEVPPCRTDVADGMTAVIKRGAR
jgi:hypothetical protein